MPFVIRFTGMIAEETFGFYSDTALTNPEITPSMRINFTIFYTQNFNKHIN